MNASREICGLTVSVPADLGVQLAAEARRLGMTPVALATELLAHVLDPAAPLLDAVLGPAGSRPKADLLSDGGRPAPARPTDHERTPR